MVPEGWKLTSLKEACNNQLQTGPFGSQLHSHEYVDEGIPVLMPKDLNDFRANIETAAKITEERGRDLKKHWLQKGDILFSRRGDVARFALIDEQASNAICGTGCLRVRASDQYYPKYLSYFLQLHQVRKWLEQNSVGQTMPNMNTEILGELPLKLATNLKEQKKIAQTLSTWDKAITTTEQLLANSQQQKKALMQQLLTGKKRLLDDNGVRFSGEWKIYHLSDLTKIVMGSSPKSAAYNEVGIGLPLLQGNADIKNRRSAPRIHTSEITRMCEVNDILLSVRAPVGTVALSNHHACIGRGIAAIRAKEDSNHNFIYQWLLWFEPRWISLSQGSTFESINSDDIKKLKIKSPKHEEQQKIAAVLSVADQEVDALTQKIDYLKQEKKALMQQLLTGKLRIINN